MGCRRLALTPDEGNNAKLRNGSFIYWVGTEVIEP
jgi:hypothetical protein